MENMMPPPPPDSSKAPGYRSTTQRMVNSPIGMAAFLFNASSLGLIIKIIIRIISGEIKKVVITVHMQPDVVNLC